MTAANAHTNAYLRTRVLTAGPIELRMMLLEGAVKFAMQGRDGLARKDFEAMFTGLTQCRSIITELMTTIRDDVDPDLAAKVRALYTFLFTEITTASMEKNLPRLDKVIQLLEYERETWGLLMQRVASERGSAPASGVAASA